MFYTKATHFDITIPDKDIFFQLSKKLMKKRVAKTKTVFLIWEDEPFYFKNEKGNYFKAISEDEYYDFNENIVRFRRIYHKTN